MDTTPTSVSEQSDTEGLTQINQEADITMCHMCKVYVSKQFLQEHNKSLKHNSFNQIAVIALQRVNDHLNDNGDEDVTESNSLTYFCTHCTAAVNTQRRILHENSSRHKKAVCFDHFVADFLYVYENIDQNDNNEEDPTESATAVAVESAISVAVESTTTVAEESATAVAFESATEVVEESATAMAFESATEVVEESATAVSFESATEVVVESATAVAFESATEVVEESTTAVVEESTTAVAVESATEVVMEIDTEMVVETATATADSVENGNDIENEHYEFDLNNYLNMLNDQYNMSLKFKVIDEERLEIEIFGRKLQLAAENFHGIKIFDNEYLECVLCNEVIANSDKVDHIMSLKHIYSVKTPFKDVHGKREIAQFWHHCAVCNVIITNYRKHTLSHSDHYNLLQQALQPNNPANTTQYVTSSETTENNMTITQTHHVGSNYNDVNLAGASVEERFFYHYITDATAIPTFVTCSVCQTVIPKSERLVAAHLKSVTHIANYTNFMTHHLLELHYADIYCNICHTFIGLRGEMVHVRGKKHLKNIKYPTGMPSTSHSLD